MALLVFGLVRPVAGQPVSDGEAPGLTLAWRAPVGCPTQAEVLLEVEKLRRGASYSTSVRADAEVVAVGKRFRLSLRTRSGEVSGARVFEGESCAEVAETAAVVLTMMARPMPAQKPSGSTVGSAASAGGRGGVGAVTIAAPSSVATVTTSVTTAAPTSAASSGPTTLATAAPTSAASSGPTTLATAAPTSAAPTSARRAPVATPPGVVAVAPARSAAEPRALPPPQKAPAPLAQPKAPPASASGRAPTPVRPKVDADTRRASSEKPVPTPTSSPVSASSPVLPGSPVPSASPAAPSGSHAPWPWAAGVTTLLLVGNRVVPGLGVHVDVRVRSWLFGVLGHLQPTLTSESSNVRIEHEAKALELRGGPGFDGPLGRWHVQAGTEVAWMSCRGERTDNAVRLALTFGAGLRWPATSRVGARFDVGIVVPTEPNSCGFRDATTGAIRHVYQETTAGRGQLAVDVRF